MQATSRDGKSGAFCSDAEGVIGPDLRFKSEDLINLQNLLKAPLPASRLWTTSKKVSCILAQKLLYSGIGLLLVFVLVLAFLGALVAFALSVGFRFLLVAFAKAFSP